MTSIWKTSGDRDKLIRLIESAHIVDAEDFLRAFRKHASCWRSDGAVFKQVDNLYREGHVVDEDLLNDLRRIAQSHYGHEGFYSVVDIENLYGRSARKRFETEEEDARSGNNWKLFEEDRVHKALGKPRNGKGVKKRANTKPAEEKVKRRVQANGTTVHKVNGHSNGSNGSKPETDDLTLRVREVARQWVKQEITAEAGMKSILAALL